MKRFLAIIAIMVSSPAYMACSSVEPNAGFEAVLTEKPWFAGHGGVDPTPIRTGLTYVAVSTDATYVNMQPRQQELTFDDLFTADGVPLDFHAAVQYQVVDSVKLVSLFGNDDSAGGMGFFKRNLEQPFRMLVRDAVKKHGLNEMAINVTAAAAVDEEVTTKFKVVIENTGVPIRLLGVTLGRANPPDAIKTQRVHTAEQEQRIKTEQQRKLAEDERKAAEESRAAADRAYNVKMDLSPAQYIQLEEIKMKRDICVKGNCTFLFGGGATPLVSVGR